MSKPRPSILGTLNSSLCGQNHVIPNPAVFRVPRNQRTRLPGDQWNRPLPLHVRR